MSYKTDAGGMTLRDYFIAHAPAEPQPWFRPEMPEYPHVPAHECLEDELVRRDVQRAFDSDSDPETEAGEQYMRLYREARDREARWLQEQRKQRYIQWPAAWADAVLATREAS